MLIIKLTKRKSQSLASEQDVRVFLPDGRDITEDLEMRKISTTVEVGEPNMYAIEGFCVFKNDDDQDKLSKYPTLRRLVLNIEYEQGGINRERSEEEAVAHAEEAFFADGVSEEDVLMLDKFLSELSEADYQKMVSGEETEMMKIVKKAPIGSEGEPVTKLVDDWIGA